MKKLIILSIASFIILLNSCQTKKEPVAINSSNKQNLYLGQKPPGLVPEIFAPDLISVKDRYEGAITFSPNLDEIYFGIKNKDNQSAIYFSKLKSKKWSPIKKVDFTQGQKKAEIHPFYSTIDNKIYFTAYDKAFKDEKIWYVNRLEGGFSEAYLLDPGINNDLCFFPNQTKNGDLYYFNVSKFKTYYATYKNGNFSEPKPLNIKGHHVFIAPNQNYLVYTAKSNKDQSRKDNDIYVCFKNDSGEWTKPKNLGNNINSKLDEKNPSITPDGKFLFFGRSERDFEPGLADIYWVSTKVIEDLNL